MPLQKSFSEQNRSIRRHQPQWQRNKSYPNSYTRDDVKREKPAGEGLLMPISSTTKNKLNIFQFGAQSKVQVADQTRERQTIIVSSDDKENAALEKKQEILDSEVHHVSKLSPPKGAVNYKTVAPITPAGRLALPDLIGMVDVKSSEQEISPDERIMWDHDIDAVQSPASSYEVLKRVKKRARSSSPMSSPAQAQGNFSGKSKTSQADPGDDLWGRYGLNVEEAGLEVPRLPALANIMYTSSPQSSNEGILSRSGSNLRKPIGRSNSCGTDWPKRRRLVKTDEQPSDDIFTESFNLVPSKFSLVNALLGKVQEEYGNTEKPKRTVVPSSLSPIRNTALIIKREEGSPLRQVVNQPTIPLNEVRPSADEMSAEDFGPANAINLPKEDSSSSDYGDFDDDAFNESVAEISSTETASRSPGPTRGGIQLNLLSLEGLRVGHFVDTETICNSALLNSHDEEFGEMDGELCTEDLESVVARYDMGLPVGDAISPRSVEVGKGVDDQVSKSLTQIRVSGADSEDEFGDGFSDVDFEAAEAAATQSLQPSASGPAPSSQKVRTIQRYFVTNVLESSYVTSKGKSRPELILLVQVEGSKAFKSIHLRDGWYETPATPKAYVHVIGEFISNQCIIDDDQNMLILHPDHLISSTVVADSFSCTRRAVLQDRVKATSAASPPLVYGTILHEIFQAAMMANRWDSEWLDEVIGLTTKRHLEDLYTINIPIPKAVEHLRSKMGELQSWARDFIASQPKAEAIVKAGNGASATMCVSKLLDVEEHVWSPKYGLKGNIDATVQVTMTDGNHSRTLTVPFEVKTGKSANASHRAQTALYNLLISDRYDIDVAYGILYYMESSETHRIPAIRHELRHMIMQRNELACFVRERHAQLPPMLKKENMCNRCYAQVPCFIYHRLADDGDGETSGMRKKFEEIVQHLTPKHKEFFLKWDNLLTKEEKESMKFRRELWTMYSSEREKVGRCFSSVIIKPGSAYEEQNNSKINRYRYTLIKEAPLPTFSFLDSQITVGEPIVISEESGNFALANGYVTNVRKQCITVAVDRRLHNARIRGPGFDEVNNQCFASIMEVAGEGSSPEESRGKVIDLPVRYRLDKDEFSNGMATVRNNLVQVMAEGPFGSREIRNLVVDLVPPQFKLHSTAYTLTDHANINIDQKRAIEKVMSAQDYALVLGMPGTGKTTTIAHIIRALVSQGKSVLLTSYTHTAVDNILLKLKDDNIPVLRLGSVAKVNSEVQEFALLAERPKTTFEELRSLWHDSPIVATTCLGINHPIFNERTFDYCIVDEASQITLPVCLGPIRMARTFVLVGDHNQLPPLVQNEEARAGGLDISLFKHLSDMHPSSVVNLEHQYRMCEDVMALSNCLIYNGRLKCGTPEVAARTINIPNIYALRNHHYSASTLLPCRRTICVGSIRGSCWLRDLIEPSTKVSFINTDTLLPLSREEAKGNRIVNSTEAKICVQLVESLLSVGVPATSIGVMTHYRSQLALLKDSLRGHSDVEMHTADRFQGRDKEVVILSLVRSNEAKSIGELLKDWRRINVAFTRAKTKLLVVGSRGTLEGNASEEMVAKFVQLMENRGWIYDLPKGALESHLFGDFATQATSSGKDQPPGTQRRQVDTNKSECFHTSLSGRENVKCRPKRVTVGERALLAGKPVLRDIMNDSFGA